VKFAKRPERIPSLQARPRRLWLDRGRFQELPGLEHRIGGLEKQDPTGNITIAAKLTENMVRIRAAKVAASRPGDSQRASRGRSGRRFAHRRMGLDVRMITGGTEGAACKGTQDRPSALRYLIRLPRSGEYLQTLQKILVPE